MNISEKAELNASIRHIERFFESRIPIYYSKLLEKLQKRRRRKNGNCKASYFSSKQKIGVNLHKNQQTCMGKLTAYKYRMQYIARTDPDVYS